MHERVVVMERTNVRHLKELPDPVSLVTLDLSFISVLKVNPPLEAVNPPLKAANPPLEAVNPPLEAANPPLEAANPPL